MSTSESMAKRFLRNEWSKITAKERKVIDAVVQRETLSRDAHREQHEQRTLGQRVADQVAVFGGSWTFILLFLAILATWIGVNTGMLVSARRVFDPYPFIFLNLLLSMIAALQAPVIMMSQNRQAMLDRAHAEADYEVNLRAEIEIVHLHEKLDDLREARWAELVRQQERQLAMLTELVADRGGARDPLTTDT